MTTVYISNNGQLARLEQPVEGAWIHLCAPNEAELSAISKELDIAPSLLHAALDEEERSRIDDDDGNTLILVDTPTVEMQGRSFVYSSIPFGIILTKENIVTVCLKESALARAFYENAVKGFSTKKHIRATLQMLYRNATLFLFYLREVDKASTRVENELHKSMKNEELVQMLGLEKSLVYFSTSLKGNEIVMEKLMRLDFVHDFPDDAELLEDVIIENKQAIEMCNIYRDILSGTRDAFASVISNNLNFVMKLLAAVTIIIALPSMIFALWGANVPVPFERSPYGFAVLIGVASICTLVAVLLMIKKKWL
ncbi:MAG: magnesium transporter CorA family protein [Oscillospiraceae bacterium]